MRKHLLAVATALSLFAVLHRASAQTATTPPIYPATPTVTVTKTAPSTVTLQWLAPTMNTDGSAVSQSQLPITYIVWSGTGAAGAPLTQVASGVTGLTWTSPTYAATADFSTQTPCFSIAAVDALGSHSVPTNVICATIDTPKPTPNPPAGLTLH